MLPVVLYLFLSGSLSLYSLFVLSRSVFVFVVVSRLVVSCLAIVVVLCCLRDRLRSRIRIRSQKRRPIALIIMAIMATPGQWW